MSGHRSDVRCLALSSDDKQLLSGSNSGCKLWDPLTGACLGSIDSGYALCCVFAPGNRHALVGSKVGAIISDSFRAGLQITDTCVIYASLQLQLCS